MSDHPINCLECAGRKKCALLKIAGAPSVKIQSRRFKKLGKNLPQVLVEYAKICPTGALVYRDL